LSARELLGQQAAVALRNLIGLVEENQGALKLFVGITGATTMLCTAGRSTFPKG